MEPDKVKTCESARNGAAGAEPRGISWLSGRNLEGKANCRRAAGSRDVSTAGWCGKTLRRKPVFENNL
jgi:hypothetical protein